MRSLAVTGAVATALGPVAIITASGVGLMFAGAAALAGSLLTRRDLASKPAS